MMWNTARIDAISTCIQKGRLIFEPPFVVDVDAFLFRDQGKRMPERAVTSTCGIDDR